jgi:hypothetical protein
MNDLNIDTNTLTRRGQYEILNTISNKVLEYAEIDDFVIDLFKCINDMLSLCMSSSNRFTYKRFRSCGSVHKNAFFRKELRIMIDGTDACAPKRRCEALTKKKTQCMNKCVGSFCHVHHKKLRTSDKGILTVNNSPHLVVPREPLGTCRGMTKKGVRCQKVAKEGHCHWHRKTADSSAVDDEEKQTKIKKARSLIAKYSIIWYHPIEATKRRFVSFLNLEWCFSLTTWIMISWMALTLQFLIKKQCQ